MAELAPVERLQPCLLDRLTDKDPSNDSESRDRRVFSMRQIRNAILRDLESLLNTPSNPDMDEITTEFPLVGDSVLNYGVRDLCGTTASSISIDQVERIIQRAVQTYEPRIRRKSVRVTAVPSSDGTHNLLGFQIEGELWAQRMEERLFIRTDVDLETGQVSLEGLSGG